MSMKTRYDHRRVRVSDVSRRVCFTLFVPDPVRHVLTRDYQHAHPFSFFGRPAGKIPWTSGNLRLTASAGVTRNSASREDHKGRVNFKGRSWANKLHCPGSSFINIQNEHGKVHWPVSGYLKKPLQHQTNRPNYSPVFCFIFHRTSCLWPVVAFLLAFGNRKST